MGDVLAFRARPARAAITPALRAALEGAAQAALDTAERIIAALDRLDGDPDREDDGTSEPCLGVPEGHVLQVPWARGGDADLERDASQEGRP